MALDPFQRAGDQPQLLDRHVLVEAPVGVVDVDPGLDQLGRDPVGVGVGVLVHELAGVGDQADVERRGHLRRDRGAEQDGEVVDDLGRAGGVDVDQVDVAEAGVVVVVVDVDDVVAALGEEVDRHAVDVAAVEEDDGAVGHVGRRLVEDLLQRQEAVLDRQRELLRAEEHHRVLAELGEQLVHAEQRAERVAVGALVGGQQEAVAGAQLGADPLEVGCGDAGRLAHALGSGSGLAGSSSSSCEIRTPCSIVSS